MEVVVNRGLQSRSAYVVGDAMQISVASMDWSEIHEAWWVSRVSVKPVEARGQGLGSQLVRALQETLVADGGGRMIVTPGGYGQDPEKLKEFYQKNGFVQEGEDVLLTWEVQS